MFNRLFFRSDALTRQPYAPLVDERRQYLAQCAAQGMCKCTLRIKARLLLSIAEYLRLAERPNDTITLLEIKKTASRWSSHNWPSPESSHAKRSRKYFIAQAAKWLTCLNRLQTPPKPITVYDQMLAEFGGFMKVDRGLSPATVMGCCSSVRPFLIQLLDRRRSLETITVSDVDSLLAQKVNEKHYARRSVRDYASSLRSFFRYAEMRGWCPVGIAASIMAPRVFRKISSGMPSLANKRVSHHTIRHATATHLLRAGVDINTIRAWLGHVSLNTTNVYAEVDLEMKAKALATCEIRGAVPRKHWKDDVALMQFLRSL